MVATDTRVRNFQSAGRSTITIHPKGFHFMKKIRTLGFGLVLAAGMAMFGTGIATAADEPSTGSAESLAAVLEALTTGSAGATDPTDPTDPGTETTPAARVTPIAEPETGSAESLAAILKALTTGSAETPDPTDPGTGGGTDPGTGAGA
ncbi:MULTISPECIES: hypothetical protein [unclassified Nocardia]|uniref:hypothetical protein n=1 Tax=unclassified Nocardia TaxID=2637762 RepID=UPI0033B45036